MANGYRESKGAVKIFLRELKEILNDKNSILRLYPREDKEFKYTTKYCLQSFGYNENDIKNELKKLTIESYVETCDDERNLKSHKYYVFYKIINNKPIYIKLKIESYDNKIILCMSFHFAEHEIAKFPFK